MNHGRCPWWPPVQAEGEVTKQHRGPSSLSSPLMQFTCASGSAPARRPHENVQSRMEFCLCIQFHGWGTRSAGDLFQGWQQPLAMKCVAVAGDGVQTAQSSLGRSQTIAEWGVVLGSTGASEADEAFIPAEAEAAPLRWAGLGVCSRPASRSSARPRGDHGDQALVWGQRSAMVVTRSAWGKGDPVAGPSAHRKCRRRVILLSERNREQGVFEATPTNL